MHHCNSQAIVPKLRAIVFYQQYTKTSSKSRVTPLRLLCSAQRSIPFETASVCSLYLLGAIDGLKTRYYVYTVHQCKHRSASMILGVLRDVHARLKISSRPIFSILVDIAATNIENGCIEKIKQHVAVCL